MGSSMCHAPPKLVQDSNFVLKTHFFQSPVVFLEGHVTLTIFWQTHPLGIPFPHTKFRPPGMGSSMCHAPPKLVQDSNFVLKTHFFQSPVVFLEGHVTLTIFWQTHPLGTPFPHTKFRPPGMGSSMCHAPPKLVQDSNFVLKTHFFQSPVVFLEGHVTLTILWQTHPLGTPFPHTKFRPPGMGSSMCHAPPKLVQDSNFVLKTHFFQSPVVFLEGHVTLTIFWQTHPLGTPFPHTKFRPPGMGSSMCHAPSKLVQDSNFVLKTHFFQSPVVFLEGHVTLTIFWQTHPLGTPFPHTKYRPPGMGSSMCHAPPKLVQDSNFVLKTHFFQSPLVFLEWHVKYNLIQFIWRYLAAARREELSGSRQKRRVIWRPLEGLYGGRQETRVIWRPLKGLSGGRQKRRVIWRPLEGLYGGRQKRRLIWRPQDR